MDYQDYVNSCRAGTLPQPMNAVTQPKTLQGETMKPAKILQPHAIHEVSFVYRPLCTNTIVSGGKVAYTKKADEQHTAARQKQKTNTHTHTTNLPTVLAAWFQ